MLTQPSSPDQKDDQTSTSLKKYEFQSKFPKNVPVIVERFEKENVPQFLNRLKFLVPYHMTVSQFATIVRDRMELNLNNGFHLLLKKRRSVVRMSQRLGKICSEYKDEHGFLYFIFVAQNTFGCPVHLFKPIKSKFPGIEPTPFGAPEPFMWMLLEQNVLGTQDDVESVSPHMDMDNEFMQAFNQLAQTMTFASQLSLPPVVEPPDEVIVLQPVAVPSSIALTFVMQALNDEQGSIDVNTSNSFNLDTPGLPFNPLIQSLNILAPIVTLQSQVQHGLTGLPLQSVNMPGPAGYFPLVNSLNQLVQVLHDQILFQPSEQSQTTEPPSNATEPLPYFPSTHFYNQTVHLLPSQIEHNSGTNQADPPGQISTTATASAVLHSISLANEIIEALQQNLLAFQSSNETDSSSSTGTSHFSLLAQYFNIVTQYLQNQIGATVSQSSGGSHSLFGQFMSDSSLDSPNDLILSPHLLSAESSFFSGPQQISYLYDSDEFSEEDIDVEYSYNC